MFNINLFPSTSREKYLVYALPFLCVHDGNGSPISAHPQGVLPHSKAGDGGKRAALREWGLDLERKIAMYTFPLQIATSKYMYMYIP